VGSNLIVIVNDESLCFKGVWVFLVIDEGRGGCRSSGACICGWCVGLVSVGFARLDLGSCRSAVGFSLFLFDW